MRNMKKRRKSPHPAWALKYRSPGTELRNFSGKFYLYAVKSVYDPVKKRAKKVTGQLLGKITKEDGFVESGKKILKEQVKTGFDPSRLSIKEYGFTHFIEHYTGEITNHLKNHFPKHWEMIVVMAYCRMVYHSCIKNMPLHFHKSFLSERFDFVLTDKKVSSGLRELGQMRETVSAYMKSFIRPGDHVLFDMTNIFSDSRNIALSKEGYNSDLVFDRQFNLLYLFSPSLNQPVYYRLFPGNMREVKGFATCLKESGINDAVVIADKGFYSEKNIVNLNSHQLNYIIPLRRNNPLIKYNAHQRKGQNYFRFNDRFIWYDRYIVDGKNICLFFDGDLKQKEEKDYLSRIVTLPESYSIEEFHLKQQKFGTIALLNKLQHDSSPEEVYNSYKSRGSIELVFDGLKNVMKGDATYMQNEDALQGWMFINHITLQWYYLIYSRLKETKMLKKVSVADVIINLREIRKARMNNEWVIEPTVKSTELILQKVGYHIT